LEAYSWFVLLTEGTLYALGAFHPAEVDLNEELPSIPLH
jgi:hypothetical protein